jgi:tRNA (cytidine56-2'-O)-methyltransferase|tara:strand:+ start:786 stop:1313 length:528 start_codon:yes stop_codon:yes gene_type:complete
MSFCHVLRIGHRPERDKRITSHVALTSRAFGAKKMYLHRSDSRVIETVNDVVGKFGGDFVIETTENPKKIIKEWSGKIVHLTMFGLPIDENLVEIKKIDEPILVVVGAEKVPPWVFEYSDFNIAIGSQPHSEVSALAIALSKISENSYNQNFDGPIQVIPSGERRNMVDVSKSDD